VAPTDTTAEPGRRAWLTPNLRVLAGVSLLQDAASELVYPVLPVFLTVTLGAPVAVVGLVEGLAEGAAAGTKLLAGRLADRRPKKQLIALGYGLAALGKVLVALSAVWPGVLAGRVVDRLGKGIRGAPRDALLMVDAPPGTRGRVFGFHRTADTLGAVLGPLLGLAAYELLDRQVRPLLLIAVVPAVLSVLLVRLVREAPPSVAARAETRASPVPLGAAFRRTTGFLVVTALVNSPDALLLLRVSQVSRSLVVTIGAYCAYNAVYALLSYPAGAVADRLGAARVYALGLGCFAVAYAWLGLATSTVGVVAAMVFYGLFPALTDGVGKALVAGLVPRGSQGRAQGLSQGLTGLGVLLAGVWSGLAWHGSGRVPLLVSAGAAALLATALAAPGTRRWLNGSGPRE